VAPPPCLTRCDESGHDEAVRILFFSQLKVATKCDSVEIAFSSSVTAVELWTELLKKFPELAGHRSSVRLARNFEYTPADARFLNSDEVALIPPVSGG
jgi:molybdopterin converting factor subunit 1